MCCCVNIVKIIKIMLLKKIFFSPIKFFFNFFFNPSIPIFQVFQTFLYIEYADLSIHPSSLSLQLFLHFFLYLLFFSSRLEKNTTLSLHFSSISIFFLHLFSTLMRIDQLDIIYHYSNPFYFFFYFILF